jgi:hypothetical protein
MTRAIIILCSSGLLLSAFTGTPAAAAGATQVVTAQPTLATLAPGETVYYDDKRCPAGMIAKFTKAPKKSQMKRACVHQ